MSAEAPRTLWIGAVLAPLAWSFDLGVSYCLVPWACHEGHKTMLHVIAVVSLVAALAGTVVAWLGWSRLRSDYEETFEGGRFLALAGLASSAFFSIVIVAQWVPEFLLGVCD